MAAGYYFFYFRTNKDVTSEESAVAVVEKGNPMKSFYEAFSTKDYRVKTKTPNSDLVITTYYQKGKFIRIDSNATLINNTMILKNKKVFYLDHWKKTFMEADENYPMADALETIYKSISPIESLTIMETPDASPWKQLPVDMASNGWIGYEALDRSMLGVGHLDMRIFVDPKTQLIMAVESVLSGGKFSEENRAVLEYQEIADIELIKQFPNDYQKEEFDSSLWKFVPSKDAKK